MDILWTLTSSNHRSNQGPRQLYRSADEAKAEGMRMAEGILDSSFADRMLDHELASMTWQLNGDTWQLMVDRLDLYVYPMTLA